MTDDTEFGRGPKAGFARRVHARVNSLGVPLTPLAARRLVDKAVADKADLADVSERTMLGLMDRNDWPENFALELVYGFEAPRLEERISDGTVEVSHRDVGALVMALVASSQLQYSGAYLRGGLLSVWPSRLGERTDAVAALARALLDGLPVAAVPRATLLATARLLDEQAADMRGGAPLVDDNEPFREEGAARFAADAESARRLAER